MNELSILFWDEYPGEDSYSSLDLSVVLCREDGSWVLKKNGAILGTSCLRHTLAEEFGYKISYIRN